MADRNVFKEHGVFIDGKVQGYSFLPPKMYNSIKQEFWCTRSLHGFLWNSGRSRAVKCEYFPKGTKKYKILGNLLDKGLENLEDHGCPKVQDLADEVSWICSSYPLRHTTTLYCAERKAKMFGN